MYLIASGTYRFYADLRPVAAHVAARSGRNVGLCAHPYDLCTYLIAQQAGVLITDPAGAPLSYALATDVECGWVGYANSHQERDGSSAPQRHRKARETRAPTCERGLLNGSYAEGGR